MTAADYLPDQRDLKSLAGAARSCRGCDLYRGTTQTVFGEGPAEAQAVFIGEGPGEQEDRRGRPFVGRAGALLDEALQEVGLNRERVYITNVVKHYKWEPRGNRRVPKKPYAHEVQACRPWLEAELEAIRPRCLICLGATSAQWLLGRAFRITKQRGEVMRTDWSDWTMATWHPAAVLRVPNKEARDPRRGELVADLQRVVRELGG